MDHLEGVLILDKMPQMDRLKVRKAVRALERDEG
jgi:peptide deformylase